ncbi:putative baseplate assembly protein [Pseudorhodoferax sp. Leaf267]|uniref:putative baseplate assembly protein n=1 Tax=Pseudorhodoferax sp. Leaf267 TaxID=1736316 RepID=UPI0006FB0832|nr:putative baseplate assembly protein [Pseudorhodoferax sp. Leaf267]KQP12268.1 hypothetical protein ASF43_22450 [Pseudorhodoferax sp. Leaf267]
MSDTPLDGCHCCEPLAAPDVIHNDAGLDTLAWRIDTHPGFYQRMLSSLPLWRAPGSPTTAPRPLAALLTRDPQDPAVALTDAAACVADVLTFYQERIANEGFLRTATERRSILELARAVGYELRPGVAASVHLVFTVEDAPGAPGVCTLAAGSPVQSVPPQGKLPQVFETSEEFVARAEWNALVPRQTRPADLALVEVAGTPRLSLLYPEGSVAPGTTGLHAGLASAGLFRLDPGLAVDTTVDALDVARVYFSDQVTGVQAGDLLLFVGKNGSTLKHLVLRAVAVEEETALRRVRVELEPLPDPVTPAAPPLLYWQVPFMTLSFSGFAQAQITSVPFTASAIGNTVASQTWQETELQAMISMQGWSAVQLVQAIAASVQPGATPVAPEAGAFTFGAKLGFFGHNAPRWASLPTSNLKGNAYPQGWDEGDIGPVTSPIPDTLDDPRTVWTDSQGNANIAARLRCHAVLERPVPRLSPGSWMVFDAPNEEATTYALFDAREIARADYGLSGRAMALRLAGSNGLPLSGTPAEVFRFRDSTAYVASRRQPLAELPIEAPVAAGSTRIELAAMVLGLVAGQRLAFAGQRADLPGVDAAEIAVLDEVLHIGGRSVLVLRAPLSHGYRRESLKIHANVVHATHGESVREVLGNGDATLQHQRFVLKKPPSTHVSAATASGVASTLELRVNGLLWDELPSLHGAAPDRHAYATRIDDDARMHALFGDGRQGARLPSGTMNVSARYRSGIGPDGEVAAHTLTMLRAMPLGLRGVDNVLPASGAQGPEKLADARRNAPLTLLAFERVVSLPDYQDFARAFPGIGKARADLAWVDGASRVLLSVAGATGGAPGDEVLANLRQAIADLSDPSQPFVVKASVLRYFRCVARVQVEGRYIAADVLAAASARVQQAFGFEARDLGQSVTAAELLALLHQVPGVVAVDLEVLQPFGEGAAAAAAAQAVPAFGGRWNVAGRSMLPAEWLLVNPAALDLVEATL